MTSLAITQLYGITIAGIAIAMLGILTATISVAVGYIIFKFGARKIGASNIVDDMHTANSRAVAELANEEILGLGDRVGTLDSMR